MTMSSVRRRPQHIRRIRRERKIQTQVAPDELRIIEEGASHLQLSLGAFVRDAAITIALSERQRIANALEEINRQTSSR